MENSKSSRILIKMLRKVLQTKGLYYSPSFDLTNSVQKQFERYKNSNEEIDSKYLNFLNYQGFNSFNTEYLWNKIFIKSFIENQLQNYILPIIMGYIETREFRINNKLVQISLISRRSTFRVGKRYTRRGVNLEGKVTNFVETEQIIEQSLDQRIVSFVQIRGSIPLLWSQFPDFRYNPKKKFSEANEEQVKEAFSKHINQNNEIYGNQTLVNLIDKKGSELLLENEFKKQCDIYNKTNTKTPVKYVHFDFHAQCKNLQWGKLSILMDQLKEDQQKYQFFCFEKKENEEENVIKQTGIFRTNCVDCLDRTNVVQGLLARRNLEEELRKQGIIQENEKIEDNKELESYLKNLWANNADEISIQYSSTPALKTDYTRTGKRTKKGALNDLKNSIKRYFLNCYRDWFSQDSLDIFTGEFDISSHNSKLLDNYNERPFWKLILLILITLLLLIILLISFGKIGKNLTKKTSRKLLGFPQLIKDSSGVKENI
eukprot:Anaeramoba_ignava/a219321_104.p1 GENE.a219321_104~~a219321_104.p1  ORF type:complete len:487 (-),score=182.47 a219321_104:80-1540(-)